MNNDSGRAEQQRELSPHVQGSSSTSARPFQTPQPTPPPLAPPEAGGVSCIKKTCIRAAAPDHLAALPCFDAGVMYESLRVSASWAADRQ